MKVRHICGMPVFYSKRAKILGYVEKAVIGDDYEIAYIIWQSEKGKNYMVRKGDFTLTEKAVLLTDLKSIKSYAGGEELSIYEKKTGDKVFSEKGEELGIVSDFLISLPDGKVWGIEVSAGILPDILQGRFRMPLSQVRWQNKSSLLIEERSKE